MAHPSKRNPKKKIFTDPVYRSAPLPAKGPSVYEGKAHYRGGMTGSSKKQLLVRWQDRIIIDPKILLGKPVVKGTRLSVDFLIELMAQGWREEDILGNYPGLTHEDLQACLGYASAILNAEKVYPVKS